MEKLRYLATRRGMNVPNANILTRESAAPEMEYKSMKVTEKLSESIQVIANEPCVAYFRIQEHVHKTVPQLVDKKHEMNYLQEKIQGSCFDTEYAINAVKGMCGSGHHLSSIQDLLKNCMFMKQQVTYEQTHSRHQMGQSASRKFHGGMTRTHTVDIPVAASDVQRKETQHESAPSRLARHSRTL